MNLTFMSLASSLSHDYHMTSYIFSTNPLARLKALGLKVAGTKAELEARYQVPSGGWRGLIEISGSMMFD